MELSPRQMEVVKSVLVLKQNVLVTGAAGTGKSTILKHLAKNSPSGLQVVASTGIAAVQVGGSTLHSWAGLGLGRDSAEVIAMQIQERGGKVYRRIKSAKILAIDEISMIGGPLLNKIDMVFRLVRKRDEPFGGILVVLFGDFLQLPAVAKTDEEKQSLFAFQSAAWLDADIKTFCLTKVFRQADQEFVSALNDIRVGVRTDASAALLNSRYRQVDTDASVLPVLVHTHNEDVDVTNKNKLSELNGRLQQFKAEDFGIDQSALAMLKKNCLAPENLELKVGAQVMLLKNVDVDRGLANGSIGVVTGFENLSRRPIIDFLQAGRYVAEINRWEIKIDGDIVATRDQYPLRLAWAVTIHKSQGMTLDKIKVHLAGCFEYGQAYVALSRARTKAGLFIEDGGKDSIKAHPEAVAFYQKYGGVV